MNYQDLLLAHFQSQGVITPNKGLEIFGDMALSDYVEALNQFGVSKVRLSEMTQEQIVLEHLKYIGPLTQMGSALLYNIWRLSATIEHLKKTLAKEGLYQIHTDLLPTKRDGHYAVYSLEDIECEPDNQY